LGPLRNQLAIGR